LNRSYTLRIPKARLNTVGLFLPLAQRLGCGTFARGLLRQRSCRRNGRGDRAKSMDGCQGCDCPGYSDGEDDQDHRHVTQRRSVVLLQRCSVNTHICRRARIVTTHRRVEGCHSCALSVVRPSPARSEAPPHEHLVLRATAAAHHCETTWTACARDEELRTKLAQAVDPNEHGPGLILRRGAGLGRRVETSPGRPGRTKGEE
jgi:hypothetical protein